MLVGHHVSELGYNTQNLEITILTQHGKTQRENCNAGNGMI